MFPRAPAYSPFFFCQQRLLHDTFAGKPGQMHRLRCGVIFYVERVRWNAEFPGRKSVTIHCLLLECFKTWSCVKSYNSVPACFSSCAEQARSIFPFDFMILQIIRDKKAAMGRPCTAKSCTEVILGDGRKSGMYMSIQCKDKMPAMLGTPDGGKVMHDSSTACISASFVLLVIEATTSHTFTKIQSGCVLLGSSTLIICKFEGIS